MRPWIVTRETAERSAGETLLMAGPKRQNEHRQGSGSAAHRHPRCSPDFWDDAVVVVPQPKEAISLRVDKDILEWFRAQGPRYQTRMNAVLRSYMMATERGRD